MNNLPMNPFIRRNLLAVALLGLVSTLSAAEPWDVIRLWPGNAPGEQPELQGSERVLVGRPRPFYQITDVSTPTLTVFQPAAEKRRGIGVLLCPGGGLQRLAIEHEGFEMADRLLEEGLTVFLLKYRVPAPIKTAVMDAQRAMGIIRSRASDWGLDPEGIGQLGFSAGGEIGAWLATHHQERLYKPVDDADRVSCRPDFVGLIYPGGLLNRRTGALKSEIADRLSDDVPPTFFVHAFNDSSLNSLEMVLALKKAKVPAELHLYQEGTHGFGARGSGTPASSWMSRFTEWLEAEGFVDRYVMRKYARDLHAAITSGAMLPRLGYVLPEADLDDAYRIQKHYVKEVLKQQTIGGFKGAGASAGAQASMGIPGPLTGVLPKEGRMDYGGGVELVGKVSDRFIVETEIGYVFAVDIANEVLTDAQMKDAVESIMPVIELPNDVSSQVNTLALTENVASNIGSERFLVGPAKKPSEVDPDDLPIKLTVDGKVLHETNGGIAKGGQWYNLRYIVNQLVSQGYTIPRGAVVICGALGGVHKAVGGRYRADFSDLGIIEFRVDQ